MSDTKNISFSVLLPYLGSFIIFLGVTRLLFYYDSFGVRITNYLDFSEIITSFLDIIVIAVVLFVILTIQNLLMWPKKEYDKKSILRQRLVDQKSFLRRLKLYFSYFDIIIFQLIGFLIVTFVWSFFNKDIDHKTYIYLIVFYLAYFIFCIIKNEVDIKLRQFNSYHTDKKIFRLLFYSLFFFGLTLIYTYSQVEAVKEKKSTYGTTIILEDNRVFFSDSSNYFIGKTQGYLFYYHEKTKTTDIIPVSKLKQLTTSKNK